MRPHERQWDVDPRNLEAAIWLLLAVDAAADKPPGTPATLDKVVAAADGINHAVMLFEEFAVGFGILTSHRLVDWDGGGIMVTTAGADLLAKTAARSWHTHWERLRPVLGGLPSERPATPSPVPASVFDQAVDDYLRSA